MKFIEITESDNVVSFGAKRHEKTEKLQSEIQKKINRIKDQQFNNIDHVVSAAIDSLSSSMSPEEAQSIVMQHLSELVMAHEYENGVFD